MKVTLVKSTRAQAMYSLMRKALFMTDPETAHSLALESLKLGHNVGATSVLCKTVKQPVTVMGLEFPNQVGMAAGMVGRSIP